MSMGSVDTGEGGKGNGTNLGTNHWGKIQLDIDALLQVKENTNDTDIDGLMVLILMSFYKVKEGERERGKEGVYGV